MATKITPQNESSRIPIVMVGIKRATGLVLADTFFTNTPYVLAAVLDFTESPAPYQYSPANLGVVLNALNPRPQALITGTALSADLLQPIEETWIDYANRWKVDGIWIGLSKTHPSPGPPPPGTGEEILRQLNEKFGV